MTRQRPLPYGDPAHQAAHQFLVEEAALLDAADYAGWLDLLCADIRYLMPVRVTTARGAGFDTLADMGHFDEDMYALRKRVQRLATDHAWTEDPPSRTRHFVTNVRTFPNSAFEDSGAEFLVESAVLLFRSRGRAAAGPAGDPGRRGGAAHPEPGGVPVSGEDSPIHLANEFTEVVVERVRTRNGARLRISVPSSGHQIMLCPLELEALAWQDHEFFAALLRTPHGPED
jgi:phthalate 3,4-dioxygenase subunit beta